MKKRSLFNRITSNGILKWSTACILAGAMSSCDDSEPFEPSKEDIEMAKKQSTLDKVDSHKSKLQRGEVAHNMHIPKLGYYHASAHAFFEHPYGHSENGRYFINGQWSDQMVTETLTASQPSADTLKQVDLALQEEQKSQPTSSTVHHHHSGGGISNALMMYWLLAGNSGRFAPGSGFQQAQGQAGQWQQRMDQDRSAVSSYAKQHPSYQRLVNQNRTNGTSVQPNQSVRKGFGSSSSSRSSSIGS